MITVKDIALAIENNNLKAVDLVTILELTVNKLDINTISEMSRLENKSPNGIRISKRYRKINIGKQVLAVKGVNDSNLPF